MGKISPKTIKLHMVPDGSVVVLTLYAYVQIHMYTLHNVEMIYIRSCFYALPKSLC